MEFPSLRPSRFGQEPERKDGFMVTAEVTPYVLAIAGILALGMGSLAKNFNDIEQERAALTLNVSQILAGRKTTHAGLDGLSISEIEKALQKAKDENPGVSPIEILADRNKISLN